MEDMRTLRLEVEAKIKANITADSKALGIPAYILYRKILIDFIHKSAKDRKKVYLNREKYGATTDPHSSE